MRNKKLIPFETIEKAVAGEPEAIDAVLRHFNSDIQDSLETQLVKAILKFRIDR